MTLPLSSTCRSGRSGSSLKHSEGSKRSCSSLDTLLGNSSETSEQVGEGARDDCRELGFDPGLDDAGDRAIARNCFACCEVGVPPDDDILPSRGFEEGGGGGTEDAFSL